MDTEAEVVSNEVEERPSFKKRLKIYVLDGKHYKLPQTRGDTINEILICKILSKFADVFYNDQPFLPNVEGFGLYHKKIMLPTRKYDLYYVRNNLAVWKKLPSPKITTALPYVLEVFKNGDGVVTFTKFWKNQLLQESQDLVRYFYKKSFVKPKKVLHFPQAYEPIFKPLQNHPQTKKIRASWKADFVFVYFGRLALTSFPHSLIQLIPKIHKRYPNKRIKFIFGGVNLTDLKLTGIDWIGNIPHHLMPYYLSAADAFVCGYKHPACHFYGSRHTIECMAVGLPIICANFAARREMLGGRYKLFWKYEPGSTRLGGKGEYQLFTKMTKLIDDKKFYNQMRAHLLGRAKLYSHDTIATQMRGEIDNFLLNYEKSA